MASIRCRGRDPCLAPLLDSPWPLLCCAQPKAVYLWGTSYAQGSVVSPVEGALTFTLALAMRAVRCRIHPGEKLG